MPGFPVQTPLDVPRRGRSSIGAEEASFRPSLALAPDAWVSPAHLSCKRLKHCPQTSTMDRLHVPRGAPASMPNAGDAFAPRVHPAMDLHSHRPSSIAKVGSVVVGLYTLLSLLYLLGYPVESWCYRLLAAFRKLAVFRALHRFAVAARAYALPYTPQSRQSQSTTSPVPFLQTVLGAGMLGPPRERPPGLSNVSMECYQNSIVQGLASLRSLRNYLADFESNCHMDSVRTVHGALHDTITGLMGPASSQHALSMPRALKFMASSEQQDAQEYFSKISEQLSEEASATWKRAPRPPAAGLPSWIQLTSALLSSPPSRSSKVLPPMPDGLDEFAPKNNTSPCLNSSETLVKSEAKHVATVQSQDAATRRFGAAAAWYGPVGHPLTGLEAQSISCTACGFSDGMRMDPFNCLTVSLPNARHIATLSDCLAAHTQAEYIDGVFCNKCTLLRAQHESQEWHLDPVRHADVGAAIEKDDFEDQTLEQCGIPKAHWVTTRKVKRSAIARAPKSLVLHINRSSFNELTGHPVKNSAHLLFAMDLDIEEWCWCCNVPEPTAMRSNSSDECRAAEGAPGSRHRYALKAALAHFGHHECGHYVCFRQQPSSDIASCSSDSLEATSPDDQWWRFSDSDVDPVSENMVLGQGSNVFMLFYEHCDAPAASRESGWAPLRSMSPRLSSDESKSGLPVGWHSHERREEQLDEAELANRSDAPLADRSRAFEHESDPRTGSRRSLPSGLRNGSPHQPLKVAGPTSSPLLHRPSDVSLPTSALEMLPHSPCNATRSDSAVGLPLSSSVSGFSAPPSSNNSVPFQAARRHSA